MGRELRMEITIKMTELRRLRKELARMQKESLEELWKRYEIP